MADLQAIKEQLYLEQPFIGGGTASRAQYEAHIEALAQQRAAQQSVQTSSRFGRKAEPEE